MESTAPEISKAMLNRVVPAVVDKAQSYIREIASKSTPESFEASWGAALYILQQAAQGNFYGTLEIRFKGLEVKPIRVAEQTIVIADHFPDVYTFLPDPVSEKVG